MYPVYPLLCAIAAHGFQIASTVIHRWMNPHAMSIPSLSTGTTVRPKLARSVSTSTLDEFGIPAYAPQSAHDGVILGLARLCILLSACLGVSRVVSSHRNFYGM